LTSATVLAASPAAVETAADALRAGQLVAFPTETVYGLGADAANANAVRAIFAAKGRPSDHPLIVHLPDASHLDAWARHVPDGARALASAFWPGPLTLILPREARVGDVVTGGEDSVGLRVPAHPVARRCSPRSRGAAATASPRPSANRYGHVSPTTAQHVADDLGDRVAMILDGGPCEVGIESTIVAFDDDRPLLMRPGGIGVDALARALGRAPEAPGDDAPRASGTHASHYAPRAAAFLVDAVALVAEIERLAERDEVVGVLARTVRRPPEFDGDWIDAPSDVEGYARELYANLRKLDAAIPTRSSSRRRPTIRRGSRCANRLERATHDSDSVVVGRASARRNPLGIARDLALARRRSSSAMSRSMPLVDRRERALAGDLASGDELARRIAYCSRRRAPLAGRRTRRARPARRRRRHERRARRRSGTRTSRRSRSRPRTRRRRRCRTRSRGGRGRGGHHRAERGAGHRAAGGALQARERAPRHAADFIGLDARFEGGRRVEIALLRHATTYPSRPLRTRT
jgi:L-threonylcarbamoyladenylate synthase